jgi:hypothetical protein
MSFLRLFMCGSVQDYDVLTIDSVVPTAIATLFGKGQVNLTQLQGLGINEMILLICIVENSA